MPRSCLRAWRPTGASMIRSGSSGRCTTWPGWTARPRGPVCPPSIPTSYSSACEGKIYFGVSEVDLVGAKVCRFRIGTQGYSGKKTWGMHLIITLTWLQKLTVTLLSLLCIAWLAWKFLLGADISDALCLSLLVQGMPNLIQLIGVMWDRTWSYWNFKIRNGRF